MTGSAIPMNIRIRIHELTQTTDASTKKGRKWIAEQVGIRPSSLGAYLKAHPSLTEPSRPKGDSAAEEIIRASGHHPYKGTSIWMNEDIIRFHAMAAFRTWKLIRSEYHQIDKGHGEQKLLVQRRLFRKDMDWLTVCRHNNWKSICFDCKVKIQDTRP